MNVIADHGVRRGRKFDQVLEGARKIFLRDGFERASVDDIAREAGDRGGTADQLGRLGDCHSALGEREEAEEFYRRAREIYDDMGVALKAAEIDGKLGAPGR